MQTSQPASRRSAIAGACFALCACSGTSSEPSAPAAADAPKIATTERGPRGGRLVFLSEGGVRLAELTRSQPTPTLDSNPSWSPDGAFVAFASTRGQAEGTTRLWVVRAATGQEPRRLTGGSTLERDPRWLPDGSAIIYAAASAESRSVDLFRLELEPGDDGLPSAAGPPRRLTRSAGQELSPTISADGKHVAYMEIAASSKDSRLRVLSLVDGTTRDLTDGPVDVTPAFDPEKPTRLAFASRAAGRNDMDIFLLDVDTGRRTALPAEDMADITGPVWSIDGRHLFATAVFRSVTTGDPILSSVVVIDVWDDEPTWRALHDPAFTESRIGVALAPRALLPSRINANAPYKRALAEAINKHLIRRTEEVERETERLREDQR